MVNSDFWLTSGWHLLDKDDAGRLLPTEDFMRAYFYRPEVAPVEEVAEEVVAEDVVEETAADEPSEGTSEPEPEVSSDDAEEKEK